jgi:hypothetical protein
MTLKTKAHTLKTALLRGTIIAGLLVTVSLPAPSYAQSEPTLRVLNSPLPESLRSKVYSKPKALKPILNRDIIAPSASSDTLVNRKLKEFSSNLARLETNVGGVSRELVTLQTTNDKASTRYYAAVATINNQLQSGTTPGNPRLVQKLRDAEDSIKTLNANVSNFNTMAVKTGHVSSEASFLLDEARAAYNIAGALEEDHVNLAQMEDKINGAIILIERMQNTINDDIARTSAYLSNERQNLRTLALAVTKGEMYGQNLMAKSFNGAQAFKATSASMTPADAGMSATPASLSGPRPLAKIRFDKQNVDFEQPVYMAVSQAIERYPNATFDLVAVAPSRGNAAMTAIETTRAKRHAEKVLRSLAQMGVPGDKINLSTNASASAQSSEVHLYIR